MGLVLLPIDQDTERAMAQQLVCWAKTATGMIDPRVVYESCVSITAQTVGQYVIPGALCGEYGPLPFTSQDQPIPCNNDSVLRPYIIFGTDLDPIDPDTCAAEGPLPPLPTPSFMQVGYIGPGEGSVLLQWSAPQAPNGVRVAIDPAGTSVTVPAGTSEYEASGLETSVVYSYTITALGDGEASSDSAPLTGTFTLLGALPDPGGVAATGTSQGSVEVSWSPVANATRYVIAVQTTGGTEVASIEDAHSPQEVDGLSPGTAYNVTVFAWGQLQSSQSDAVLSLESSGATVQVTTMPVQLAAPTGVSAAAGPDPTTEVEVSWNTVDFADDYRVEYSSDGGTTWTDAPMPPGTNPPLVIAGLTPGTPYQFRVFAADTSGVSQESPPSATVTASTDAPQLAAPTNVNVPSITATTMTLSWDPVTGAGGYLISYSSDAASIEESVGAPPQQITDLTPSTEYRVQVAATTAGGTQPLSPWSSVLTTSTPPA